MKFEKKLMLFSKNKNLEKKLMNNTLLTSNLLVSIRGLAIEYIIGLCYIVSYNNFLM